METNRSPTYLLLETIKGEFIECFKLRLILDNKVGDAHAMGDKEQERRG